MISVGNGRRSAEALRGLRWQLFLRPLEANQPNCMPLRISCSNAALRVMHNIRKEVHNPSSSNNEEPPFCEKNNPKCKHDRSCCLSHQQSSPLAGGSVRDPQRLPLHQLRQQSLQSHMPLPSGEHSPERDGIPTGTGLPASPVRSESETEGAFQHRSRRFGVSSFRLPEAPPSRVPREASRPKGQRPGHPGPTSR